VENTKRTRSIANYPKDIVEKMLGQYEADALGLVHCRLEDLGDDRLIRCALYLAAGSIERLEAEVKLGQTDFRDLIMAAECDKENRRLRDFNRPFGSEDCAPHGG
jgi:hypothetical protein